MKAVIWRPEVLKYGDLPDPVAAPGDVVIDGRSTINGSAACPSTKIIVPPRC